MKNLQEIQSSIDAYQRISTQQLQLITSAFERLITLQGEQNNLVLKLASDVQTINTEIRNLKGRPKLSDEQIILIQEFFKKGYSLSKIAELVDCSKTSVHKYTRQSFENTVNEQLQGSSEFTQRD